MSPRRQPRSPVACAPEHVIAAVYVIPVAGRAMRAAGGGLTNTIAMDSTTGSLLTAILDHAASRTVVFAMGNPYLVQDFPAELERIDREIEHELRR